MLSWCLSFKLVVVVRCPTNTSNEETRNRQLALNGPRETGVRVSPGGLNEGEALASGGVSPARSAAIAHSRSHDVMIGPRLEEVAAGGARFGVTSASETDAATIHILEKPQRDRRWLLPRARARPCVGAPSACNATGHHIRREPRRAAGAVRGMVP
jgi:hypothetical protein